MALPDLCTRSLPFWITFAKYAMPVTSNQTATLDPAPAGEHLYRESLRQTRVKHAIKTGLACCLCIFISYVFHLPGPELGPTLAFVLMTVGMPAPRINWFLTQVGVIISAIVSGLILVISQTNPSLFLMLTLLWIFFCLLFTNWFRFPPIFVAMISAIGIFTAFMGTVEDTLNFYVAFVLNWLVAGFSVVVIETLLWPLNTTSSFLRLLGKSYTHLEQMLRHGAHCLRTGEPAVHDDSAYDWAPFRPLRRFLAPELRTARKTANPFGKIILACRSVNVRLWFFERVIAPALPAALPATLPAGMHLQLADSLDRCAAHVARLLQGLLDRQQVPPLDPDLVSAVQAAHLDVLYTPDADNQVPLAHGILQTLFSRIIQGLQELTACHNLLITTLARGLNGELASSFLPTPGTPLMDGNSLRVSTKLVIILVLLLLEELFFGFLGGTMVAFFAVFFCSTGNLGKQNKNDFIGVAGLLAGFLFGLVAGLVISHPLEFPLMLAVVFLGQFLFNYFSQVSQRYGYAGIQAGLALPFAYLATQGPELGSFELIRTRLMGLILAGLTAVVVHAHLWPVLPMQKLRGLIAASIKETAVSLGQLFSDPRETWLGPPSSLGEIVSHSRDLLDDARYLPGTDHADPAYHDILICIQEIDASLEYMSFLISLEPDHVLLAPLFQAAGDYARQARENLLRVAGQFQKDHRRADRIDAVAWRPEVLSRWITANDALGPLTEPSTDTARPAVIAQCLDQIALATVRISAIAKEINLRNR